MAGMLLDLFTNSFIGQKSMAIPGVEEWIIRVVLKYASAHFKNIHYFFWAIHGQALSC
jgi:hypothetical protein